MQPIEIWGALHRWGNEEYLEGNKEKARKLWKIAEKYEKLQFKLLWSR